MTDNTTIYKGSFIVTNTVKKNRKLPVSET